MYNFRKINERERLYIEDAISDFGVMELYGGSREEKDGKIIYHLSFYSAHLSPISPEAGKVGRRIKKVLRADEIWLYGTKIA